MGKERRFYWTFLWAAVIVQMTMSTDTANVTTTETPTQISESSSGYAWSAWGKWSRCSRTCGGGVAYQERQCLPRALPVTNGTAAPVVTVRVTRQAHNHECFGESKRYRECNTEPCVGSERARSMRAEQCAVYDRKPFRGRFYTWVPYIDGDHPCLLNCRPLGQQFYASLSIVADGTPCTKPGARAMCVGGVCKVVGRETILAGQQELRCGRRLVSGLFSRPRLPLGYSYVTTVPRGACRLNVSEIVTTENYIALKILNGSYIMNGEFAVSSPGTYEAAGARFLYTRAGGLDQVFAHGPILEPIDIMILYTQPKPNIKYEYFTESPTGDADVEPSNSVPEIPPTTPTKHTRRHHNFIETHRSSVSRHPDLTSMSKELEDNLNENVVGERKFMWKIVSYSQCTRTCGGGIQVGKYRCVESSASSPDREVSSVHCAGSAPGVRRRRCGAGACPPRWRTAAWSPCPACGPATRRRIVGCVQDHSRGITKISDQKCPPNRPHTTEKCNIPNCDEANISNVRRIEPKRVKPREHVDSFQAGPVYTVAVNNTDIDIGPEYSFSATAGWLFTEWSECVGWCTDEGIQTRGVRCADPAGCEPRVAPLSHRACTPNINCDQQGDWFVGEWSKCSSPCGGKQIRGVVCLASGGRRVKDSACKPPRPRREKDCGSDCKPAWYFSDWGKCTGSCSEGGEQRRSVVCAGAGAVTDAECGPSAPDHTRPCPLTCHTDITPHTHTTESQKRPEYEVAPTTTTSTTTTTTQKTLPKSETSKECQDRLSNCQLVVQARLCHYNFYVVNCCRSCYGR